MFGAYQVMPELCKGYCFFPKPPMPNQAYTHPSQVNLVACEPAITGPDANSTSLKVFEGNATGSFDLFNQSTMSCVTNLDVAFEKILSGASKCKYSD